MANRGQNGWNASDYAANSVAQAAWATELLGRLDLRAHDSVVDLGCGDGAVTAEIAHRVPDGFVCGVDSSPDMIAYARSTYSSSKIPNLAFHHQDISSLSLPEKFDVAFSNAALHWVQDQAALLTQLATCLNPGARVCFSCGGIGNAAAVLAAVEATTQDPVWSGALDEFTCPYHFHDSAEYRRWLEQAGYSVIRVDLVHKDMAHASPEGFRAWLRTTWHPYTDCLPETERERFISAVTARYLDSHPTDSNGRAHVAMVRLEVEATLTAR